MVGTILSSSCGLLETLNSQTYLQPKSFVLERVGNHWNLCQVVIVRAPMGRFTLFIGCVFLSLRRGLKIQNVMAVSRPENSNGLLMEKTIPLAIKTGFFPPVWTMGIYFLSLSVVNYRDRKI